MENTNIQEIVRETINELERQGKVKKPSDKTPYQRTEAILYNLNDFYKGIDFHMEQIEYIKSYGTQKKSKSFTTYLGEEGYIEKKSELELIDEKIEEEKKVIYRTQLLLDVIENAIDAVEDEKEIVTMLFRDKMTPTDVSISLGISESSVSRAKKAIINELARLLFPDALIKEYLY